MNLLNTAIYEVDEGEVIILWGGRRIVTTCLVPPLVEGDETTERVWKRRYRKDSGNILLTRIYDNYSKREDYNTGLFGRNPAIIKDEYGRLIIAYRIPIISSQDPMGALSSYYVVPQNVGTTAGMNFWKVYNEYDFSKFSVKKDFDWQEQTDIPVDYMTLTFQQEFEDLGDLYDSLSDEIKEVIPSGSEFLMFTDITQHRLTGEIWIRGMGGNRIDDEKVYRWHWNEKEGLGRTYPAGIVDYAGRQVRLYGNQILASLTDKWDDYKSIWQTQGNYGISGNIRQNKYGKDYIAGFSELNQSIPYVIETGDGIQTEKLSDEREKKNEEIWAEYNERDEVLENANIPNETYFSYETPPSDEELEEIKKTLAYYYYALPTLYQERPGLCISKTGLIFLSWMHGNTMFIEKEKGKYIAVGLRIAVSYDNGKTFEPLCPERVNRFE